MTTFHDDPDFQDGHERYEQLLRGDAEIGLVGDVDAHVQQMLDALWKAAARGNALAFADLGDLYLSALRPIGALAGVEDPQLQTRAWPADAQHIVDAANESLQAALRCFHGAARLGDRTAAVRFAALTRSSSENNQRRALELLRSLPEPTPPELYQQGLVHYWLGEHVDSAKAHLAAAERGNTDAMFELGIYYGQGIGVSIDPDAAHRWVLAAAEGNHPRALYNLGASHARGQGGQPDLAKAAWFYERAAAAGSGRAAATLAVMILGGELEGTTEQAITWLDRAEELGVDAMAMLDQIGIDDPREE